MAEKYKSTWYPFSAHPGSDSCWSLSTGPDRRVYAASCLELQSGGTVKLFRYNDKTDALDHLLDIEDVVEDPPDSGRATQCKIHYSFAPSASDGILYMATHLSAPPQDQLYFSPWKSWHDPVQCFRGSALVAYDVHADSVLWWDTLIPREGCRCLLLDEERGLLYALSYPRDHLVRYDLRSKERTDLGRIGSVNAQVLFLDARHRVWTSSDEGRLVRYDPETERLEFSPFLLPHCDDYQTGWHSVLYDAVAHPEEPCVYATTWYARPHLMRFWPEDGDWGRLENLGPVSQDHDPSQPFDFFIDHCGGLTFAGDGCLYYGASRWRDPIYNPLPEERREWEGVIWRLDPRTLEKEEVAMVERTDALSQYITRATVDRNGDLFFGTIIGPAEPEAGIFRVELPEDRKMPESLPPLRVWG